MGLVLLVVRLVRPDLAVALIVERLQLVIFPLFLVALWQGREALVRIPSFAIVAAAIIGVATTAFGYFYVGHGQEETVIVSRLANDLDEGATSIFRERIKYFLRFSIKDLTLLRFYKSFGSDRDARELFTSKQHVEGVIWGDSRFLRISFPDRSAVKLASLGTTGFSPVVGRLQLVESVPVTGLSFEPRESTAFFISRLFEGMIPPVEKAIDFDSTYRSHYAQLHLGASIAALHTSRGHRAFALWRAGTDSIIRYLRGGGTEPGYLNCGKTDLLRADSMLRRGENVELAAAIAVNLGVLKVLEAELSGDRFEPRAATKLFKAAVATQKQRNTFGVTYRAFLIAKSNIAVLRGRGSGIGKKARRGTEARDHKLRKKIKTEKREQKERKGKKGGKA